MKTAIVTGAARGIGLASALRLARAGHDIVIVDLLADEAARAADSIRSTGQRARVAIADVSDLAAALRIADETVAEFGRIDLLVCNAGRTMSKGLLDITEAEWDATIDVNLKSAFCWARAVAPHMQAAGGGRIVNISSLNAITGGVARAVSKFAYAAAKAGILGLTRSLSKELAPLIAVNAILPGIIETDINAAQVSANREMLQDSILLQRLGRPEDIAAWVAFLGAEPDMFVTGQSVVVDGGQWVT